MKRAKKPVKRGPFRPGQLQPLHVTLRRELAFSYAAQLEAAREVILHVGYHPEPKPNEWSVYLAANGVTVHLVYDSAEAAEAAKAKGLRITLPTDQERKG